MSPEIYDFLFTERNKTLKNGTKKNTLPVHSKRWSENRIMKSNFEIRGRRRGRNQKTKNPFQDMCRLDKRLVSISIVSCGSYHYHNHHEVFYVYQFSEIFTQ